MLGTDFSFVQLRYDGSRARGRTMEGLPLADSEHPRLRLASEARAEIESLGGVVETAILIKDLREAYKDTITGKLGNALRALRERAPRKR